MKTSGYQTMKELINKISSRIHQLEKGELRSEEIDVLTDECRDLYERLTVLRYKAWEKGLIAGSDVPEIKPVGENEVIERAAAEEPEEKADKELPPFRLNISPVAKENPQTNLLDEMESPEEENETQKYKQSVNEIPVKIIQQDRAAESSVNDRLSAQKTSFAEKQQRKPIADLRTAIGLNQKFLFMNDLFEGENEAYNEAIQKLNSFSSADDAKNYLLSLGTKYDWDPESESVIQFCELVERRYA